MEKWNDRKNYNTKEKTLAIGVWPEVSLVEARKKRDEAKMLLKTGKDPSNEKKKNKIIEELDISMIYEVVGPVRAKAKS